MTDTPKPAGKSLTDLIAKLPKPVSGGGPGGGFTFPTGKAALLGGMAVLAFAAFESVFTVDPTQRAMVRMLGQVTTEKPLGPGLHFRVPFISHVDRAQVSLTNLHIPIFSVNTIDNQKIDLDINVSYLIPESAVYHLMYEVGRVGDADVRENIVPVVQDRVSRVFSIKNTNNISEGREGIQAEATRAVTQALKDLFKIDMQSLQIAKIIYTPAFIQSNERSVTAKNEAIAEENRVKVAEFQAKQKITTAEGEAQQVRVRAAGDAEATRLRARAEKEAAELQGQGQAARFRSEIDGAGGFTNYVSLINAQSRLKWNGVSPRFMMGGNGAANFLMPLPENELQEPEPAARSTQPAPAGLRR